MPRRGGCSPGRVRRKRCSQVVRATGSCRQPRGCQQLPSGDAPTNTFGRPAGSAHVRHPQGLPCDSLPGPSCSAEAYMQLTEKLVLSLDQQELEPPPPHPPPPPPASCASGPGCASPSRRWPRRAPPRRAAAPPRRAAAPRLPPPAGASRRRRPCGCRSQAPAACQDSTAGCAGCLILPERPVLQHRALGREAARVASPGAAAQRERSPCCARRAQHGDAHLSCALPSSIAFCCSSKRLRSRPFSPLSRRLASPSACSCLRDLPGAGRGLRCSRWHG